MTKTVSHRLMIVAVLVMIMAAVAACAAPAAAPAGTQATTAPAAAEKVKIGLSFSDFATERWKPESEIIKAGLEKLGYEVLVQEANHDVKLQNDQIDNMVSQGVKALIVVAEDGDAVATSVDKAADAGVKVIAYDRLIKTPRSPATSPSTTRKSAASRRMAS